MGDKREDQLQILSNRERILLKQMMQMIGREGGISENQSAIGINLLTCKTINRR